MKAYTIDFHSLQSLTHVNESLITTGIQVAQDPKGPGRQVNLGQSGPGCRWEAVKFAVGDAPTVLMKRLYDAHPISREKAFELARPHKPKEFDDLLLRIITRTTRFGLTIGHMSAGTEVLACGKGRGGEGNLIWDDSLVRVSAHHAVTVHMNKQPFAVVTHNGATADVVYAADYEEFFVPHLKAA